MFKINDYLKKQPIIYQILTNAFKNQKLSHAYLISSNKNTILKEIAIYLAKSLVCEKCNEKKIFACEQCNTCKRVENNQYIDIIVKDNNVIKKEDVDDIIENFSRTATEAKNKKIYIIHLIENMTIEATNAILKFLEEPNSNTYAFLTTQNESKILPTVLSRVQKLKLCNIERKEIIELCQNSDLNLKDIEILSYFYNDTKKIIQQSQNSDFIIAKQCFDLFLENIEDSKKLLFNTIFKIIKQIGNKKETCKLFFDMLIMFLQDLINFQNNSFFYLSTYSEKINNLVKKILYPEKFSYEIIKLKKDLTDFNISINNTLVHLALITNNYYGK